MSKSDLTPGAKFVGFGTDINEFAVQSYFKVHVIFFFLPPDFPRKQTHKSQFASGPTQLLRTTGHRVEP